MSNSENLIKSFLDSNDLGIKDLENYILKSFEDKEYLNTEENSQEAIVKFLDEQTVLETSYYYSKMRSTNKKFRGAEKWFFKALKNQLDLKQALDSIENQLTSEDFIKFKSKKVDEMYYTQNEQVEQKDNFFYGKRVIYSGDFDNFPYRNELAALLWGVGAIINKSFNNSTEYLIVGSSGVGPSKLKKAEQKNIPVVTEKEFMEHFKWYEPKFV